MTTLRDTPTLPASWQAHRERVRAAREALAAAAGTAEERERWRDYYALLCGEERGRW